MATSIKQRAKIAAWVLVAAAVATAPVGVSAVAQSANTVINASVQPVISIATATPVAISLTPTAGGVVSSASDTVTVNTNNSIGYNLTMKDADTNTNLVSGSNTIAASSGTMAASGAIVLANNTWGFAVPTATTGAQTNNFDSSYSAENSNGSSTSKWAGVPASSGTAVTLKNTSTTATNDTTTVWYGVRVNTSQPSGVSASAYTDTVTYTATTN